MIQAEQVLVRSSFMIATEGGVAVAGVVAIEVILHVTLWFIEVDEVVEEAVRPTVSQQVDDPREFEDVNAEEVGSGVEGCAEDRGGRLGVLMSKDVGVREVDFVGAKVV
ncbi:hypothetical protein VNO78_11362 [Psophocarpus tetragonolobus]|uniref:Uncharacterized protein n=1 Tax=Psophocarpus tetragonolobus TaxID=3891 RepID=A0AAN9XNV6_PSOTE